MPAPLSPEMKRLNDLLTKDILWIYILSILRKHGKTHAYVMRERINAQFGFKPGQVTAYVVLYKLQSRGYVSAISEEKKKIYTITKEGKALLAAAEAFFNEKLEMLF